MNKDNLFGLELVSSLYVVTFITLFYKSFSADVSVYFELISNVFGWGIIWLRSPTIYALKHGIDKSSVVALIGLYIYSLLNISFWILKISEPSLKYEDVQYNIEFVSMIVFSGACSWIYITNYVKYTTRKG